MVLDVLVLGGYSRLGSLNVILNVLSLGSLCGLRWLRSLRGLRGLSWVCDRVSKEKN